MNEKTLVSVLEELAPGYHCRKTLKELNHDRIHHSWPKRGTALKKRQK